jgi:hypothetical protein
MTSEWLNVMLEEIARKKAEADQARIEAERRREECRPEAPPRRDDTAQGAKRTL